MVENIIRKGYEVNVKMIQVSKLDINKCSPKFLNLNLPNDTQVYIKCDKDGNLDLRGKKQHYRIYKKDESILIGG